LGGLRNPGIRKVVTIFQTGVLRGERKKAWLNGHSFLWKGGHWFTGLLNRVLQRGLFFPPKVLTTEVLLLRRRIFSGTKGGV